jgi:hypothetical protein
MSHRSIIYYHKSGAPAVIGQMEAGRFIGVWRGYYASGAPMWEAAGGWFTGMGTGLEFSEQIRECKEDLKDQDDSDEIDPISSQLSEQDQDDDDDHADDMEILGLCLMIHFRRTM